MTCCFYRVLSGINFVYFVTVPKRALDARGLCSILDFRGACVRWISDRGAQDMGLGLCQNDANAHGSQSEHSFRRFSSVWRLSCFRIIRLWDQGEFNMMGELDTYL